MDVLANAFNQHLGLVPSQEPGFEFELLDSPVYRNHLGTVHAAAQFALAEATSAAVLLRAVGERFPDCFAVVRRVEGKFRDALTGVVRGRGLISESHSDGVLDLLATKGRALATVMVEACDDSGKVGLKVEIEWFLRVAPLSGAS